MNPLLGICARCLAGIDVEPLPKRCTRKVANLSGQIAPCGGEIQPLSAQGGTPAGEASLTDAELFA